MGTLSKETGAVAGISQRQERYKRSAPAFLIILAALVLLLGFSMVLSVCTGIAGGSFKAFAETVMFPAKASGVGMIMLEMRMPRALAAGLTGMALSLIHICLYLSRRSAFSAVEVLLVRRLVLQPRANG